MLILQNLHKTFICWLFYIFIFYFCCLQCTEIVKTAIIIAYFRHFLCIDIKVMREFKTVKLAYICSIRRCNIMRLPRLSSFSLSLPLTHNSLGFFVVVVIAKKNAHTICLRCLKDKSKISNKRFSAHLLAALLSSTQCLYLQLY